MGLGELFKVRELGRVRIWLKVLYGHSMVSLLCSGVLSAYVQVLCELESTAEMSGVFLGGFLQQAFREHTLYAGTGLQEPRVHNQGAHSLVMSVDKYNTD